MSLKERMQETRKIPSYHHLQRRDHSLRKFPLTMHLVTNSLSSCEIPISIPFKELIMKRPTSTVLTNLIRPDYPIARIEVQSLKLLPPHRPHLPLPHLQPCTFFFFSHAPKHHCPPTALLPSPSSHHACVCWLCLSKRVSCLCRW